MENTTINFIDLFAGLGGTRVGFEMACALLNIKPKCVFTSEIKKHAIDIYKDRFKENYIHGDITKINPSAIPDFNYLLAGFPCQPFSSAGRRKGFLDKRGGLFFTIKNILKEKNPQGFLLENVDGLVAHNKGETLKIILSNLQMLGYNVSWKILDASNFGVPQKRRRVYIVGNKNFKPNLEGFENIAVKAGSYIEKDAEVKKTNFTKILTSKFKTEELYGKSIKDKRGGKNNIHSWDLEIKGKVNQRQKHLLELILKKRRYKKWAKLKAIDWMDGMPLTIDEIKTFYKDSYLQDDLNYLTNAGYLRLEHPKKKIIENGISKRVPCKEIQKGYNIVSGKLSFPISKIIDPDGLCPTIVATEAGKIAVSTSKGVRPITILEGLRFSGFPKSYIMKNISYNKAFDLIGNTVMPPVIKEISLRVIARN